MPSNPEEIVQQMRAQFETLLAYVQNTSGEPVSAYEMERRLVTDLLALGRLLLLSFVCTQQKALEDVESVHVGGKRLPRHSMKKRSLRSVFGKITFVRGYYYQDNQGYFLLDTRLNLPQESASDLFRQWRSHLACYHPYNKAGKTLATLLGQRPSTRAIEDDHAHDRDLAETFYKDRPVLPPASESSILVVQADGKGVPILSEKPKEDRVRLGKGEKSGGKKEAIATTVYTIEPCMRTPEQVTAHLFKSATPQESAASAPDAGKKREGPRNKWLWATLTGKSAAIAFTKQQVQKRDGEHIRARVALTDGSAPLQHHVLTQLPTFVLVLDVIHAIEYLWEAANGIYGEKSPQRQRWVRERVLRMLSGGTQQIIDEFRTLADAPKCTKRASKVLLDTVRYYQRNLPYMRYDDYLAQGWPIGTGVIEGACRHLIKDRCELSGMRWAVTGAEGLLHLRSIAENDDWEDFEAFRQNRRRKESYGNILQIGRNTTIERAAMEAKTTQARSKAA
jgi:hypothetical protein